MKQAVISYAQTSLYSIRQTNTQMLGQGPIFTRSQNSDIKHISKCVLTLYYIDKFLIKHDSKYLIFVVLLQLLEGGRNT